MERYRSGGGNDGTLRLRLFGLRPRVSPRPWATRHIMRTVVSPSRSLTNVPGCLLELKK